jgi:hypothetical protein
MTYVDGLTLAEKKNLTAREAGLIFLDVLKGLAQLHDKNITHRDLKPSNVVLTPDGRAVLIDLGIVHVESEPSRTAPGVAMGTVLYMSPEQALGQKVGPASDVFAAGLTLYHLLTDETVYEGVPELETRTGQAVLMYLGSLHHAGQELEIHFPSHVPLAMRAVVEKACRIRPEDRFPDAHAMQAALRQALQPEESDRTHMMSAVDVKQVAVRTAGRKARRRGPRVAASAAVAAGIAAGIAVAWIGSERGWWSGLLQPEHVELETQQPDEPIPPEPPSTSTAFEATLETLLSTPAPWADLEVRFWVEPDPVPIGESYHLFLEADCDCWPLLFSIDSAEQQITMLFPNALEGTRRLGRGVEQIPSRGDPILGGGGGVLREHEPGVHFVKLLLIPSDVEQQLALPVRGPDEAMWSVRSGQGERIAELQRLLDGLASVRFASRTLQLRAVPADAKPAVSEES